MKGPQLSAFNYSIKNQGNDSVDIYVDGYIVDSPTLEMVKQFWGDETSVSYKSFRDSIPANVKTINLYVNCSGGHVGDAMAMRDHMASLEDSGVVINREGRGIVASAGTYLVMGKNSRLSENCLFMIHEVSGLAYGDVSSCENQVKAMRKFNDLIVNFYCRETGLSTTVVGNMMKQETWLNASDAKEKGFVQATGPKATLTNSIKPENWPFTNMAMLNTYNSFITNSNNNSMDSKNITDAITTGFNNLMEKLGLSNKKEDEGVKNAFAEFSKSITESITNIKVEPGMTSEEITNLVNTAVTNSLKTLPENFAQAIKDANKDFVTSKMLDDKIANNLSKEDFTKEMTELKTEIIDKIGGGADAEKGDGKKKKTNDSKNKYAYENLWN